MLPEELVDATICGAYLPILKGLLCEAEKSHPDVLILECGGDVMWGNIPALLTDSQIKRNVVAATMCSTDYMAAFGAYAFVRQHGLSVPILFDVPLGKEAFYRRGAFERLVSSRVLDIMQPAEMAILGQEIHKTMGG